MSRSRNTGMVIAVLTAIAFSGSGPFAKPLMLAGWSPNAVVVMRLAAAALVVMPVALWQTRADLSVWWRRWRWILGYGVIALAAAQLFYYSAVARMPVSMALLIQYLSPVLMLMAAWGYTKYRPAALSLVGSALSVIGLVFALDVFGSGEGLDPIGILLATLSMLAVCGYYLIAAAIPDDLPPTALIGGGLVVAALATGLVGVSGLAPLEFHFSTVELLNQQAPWWVSMAVVVLVGTVGGYLGGVAAAKILGSRLASFFGILEVLAAIGVSAILLAELPTSSQLIGAALVIGGVVCVRLAPDTVTVEAPLGPVTAPITLPLNEEEFEVLRELEEAEPITASIPVIRDDSTLAGGVDQSVAPTLPQPTVADEPGAEDGDARR